MRGWAPLAPIPQELEAYEDLIYTPLAMPDPPQIDFQEFFDWAQGAEPLQYEGTSQPLTPGQLAAQSIARYPWQIVRCYRNDISPNWAPEFSQRFPQLKDYILSFPIKRLRIAAFLIQQQHVPGFLHCDVDDGIGLRFYLKNTLESRLVFHKTHRKIWARPLTFKDGEHVPEQRDLSRVVDLENPIPAKQPRESYAWAVTATKAMHTVLPVDQTGIKITCSLMPEMNTEHSSLDAPALRELLDKSTALYRDYQIWY